MKDVHSRLYTGKQHAKTRALIRMIKDSSADCLQTSERRTGWPNDRTRALIRMIKDSSADCLQTSERRTGWPNDSRDTRDCEVA
ncbi:6257_t:CDS:2 [Funneliformis caledonium]|uniref:6257_t:CDS:1 n=1 Tax=Funneliformis caledonium TaxID=1117310 RepID=A0A9N9B8U9_9GLOM|nr:6257_t:CDS:2 [Funneliformis caledonium]